ncbi:MAG: site-specific integrase, partial [Deltaproteobacteria bacterium]|nr:site-specific integrase [Deltaproteobacteria bacterium]
MASFESRGSRVRAHVNLKGVRASETFESKAAARAWATRTEAEIIAGHRGETPDKTFGELLQRYADKISPTKKGARWELVRIGLLQRDPIALVPLADLTSAHVAEWRDRRLEGVAGVAGVSRPVKGASVRREWNLCSAACSVAIGEWKWLRLNPFSKAAGAKRPKNSPHRDELILEADLVALQSVADKHSTPTYRQVMRAARFAIETAMRSGEVIFLGRNPERV